MDTQKIISVPPLRVRMLFCGDYYTIPKIAYNIRSKKEKYTLLRGYIFSHSQLVKPTQLWVGGSIHRVTGYTSSSHRVKWSDKCINFSAAKICYWLCVCNTLYTVTTSALLIILFLLMQNTNNNNEHFKITTSLLLCHSTRSPC